MPAPSPDPSIDGQVAIVTGASAGIGAATARLLARRGARVVVAARGASALEAVAAEIGGVAVVADVGSAEGCKQLVDATVAAFGGIDIVVNNAGCHHRGPFATLQTEQIVQMVHVNLLGPLLLSRLALPYLERSPRGVLVQVGSLAGFLPMPGAATYGATKAAVRSVARALAEELGAAGVRSCYVSPGPVATDFILQNLDSVADVTFSQPMSTAEEVAEVILACITGGTVDAAIPGFSGKLATLGYLFPGLWRRLRPHLARRGRRRKEQLRRDGRGA